MTDPSDPSNPDDTMTPDVHNLADIRVDQNVLHVLKPLLMQVKSDPRRQEMWGVYAMVDNDMPQDKFSTKDRLACSLLGVYENLVAVFVQLGLADLQGEQLDDENESAFVWTLLGLALMPGGEKEIDQIIDMWTSDDPTQDRVVSSKTGEVVVPPTVRDASVKPVKDLTAVSETPAVTKRIN